MRRAELTGIRVRDVEWKTGVVDVRHGIAAVYGETGKGEVKPKRGQAVRLVDGEPKPGKARPVDLDAATLTREEQASPLPILNRAGLLFANADGTALRPD